MDVKFVLALPSKSVQIVHVTISVDDAEMTEMVMDTAAVVATMRVHDDEEMTTVAGVEVHLLDVIVVEAEARTLLVDLVEALADLLVVEVQDHVEVLVDLRSDVADLRSDEVDLQDEVTHLDVTAVDPEPPTFECAQILKKVLSSFTHAK